MAIGTRLTLAGALLLSKAITGKQLTFTRGAFGDAKVDGEVVEPTDEQQDNLDALINERMSLPIYSYEIKSNGNIVVTVKVKNASVASKFRAREAGLFAIDPDTQQEILYSYCYEGADGDTIYAKSAYCVLEYYVELVTTIANADNVTCVINIIEKIKTGAGLSRAGDTISANIGTGLGVNDDNDIYLKTGSATQKGGFKVGENLYVSGDSLNATGYTLPTGSATQKGGFKVGENLYTSGDSLNASLPTGSATKKGGFKVGKNLYVSGDSLNGSVDPYDDSLLTSRLNQLEINQSNLFMKLDADNQLGFTSNLLLVEDFTNCDKVNLTQLPLAANSYDKFVWLSDVSGFAVGYNVTFVQRSQSQTNKIANIRRELIGGRYIYFADLADYLDVDYMPLYGAKMYRSTIGFKNGVAYGPGDLLNFYRNHTSFWKGEIKTTSSTRTLNTTAGQESNFELSGDFAFTADGYFTLA